ncbi:polysaccharide pyruvyl transferase family protein [Flavobacterium sp.]|uniref:polysaccharide pyruvyl transferase family protein n=1 Tax=Flavobacterium sp. TaxID=239 RepID=UPI0040471BC6
MAGRIIVGYYGCNNLGDDLMLYSWIKNNPNVNYFILKRGKANYTFLEHIKQSYVFSNLIINTFFRFITLFYFRLRGFNQYVMLGGTQLSMNSSRLTHLLLFLEIKFSILLGFSIFSERVGIGSINNINCLLKNIIYSHDYFVVRDQSSYEKLKLLKFSNVTLSNDLVFDLKEQFHSNVISSISNDPLTIITATGSVFKKSIELQNLYLSYLKLNMSIMTNNIVFVVFQLNEDEFMYDLIVKEIPNINFKILSINKIQEIIDLYNDSELVIGSRYHSIILGDIFNKKFIGISYDDKVFDQCIKSKMNYYEL